MAEEEKTQASEEAKEEVKEEVKETPEVKEEVKTEEPKAEEKKEEPKEVEKPVKKEEPKPAEKAKEEQKPEAKKKSVKVPENLKKIVKDIENLKVLDLAILVKVLEEKFGVSATPQIVAQAAPGAGPSGEQDAAEKKFFNILLTAVGEKKIEVIKAVRDITQRGLKESKDLVDEAAKGPQIIKENAKKEEAEEIKKKLETAGATVDLK